MPLSPRALKAISGAGAVAICGISAALVAIDPKPESAPLRPTLSGDVSTTPAALVIPPSCATVGSGATSPSIDPSLLPLIPQLRQATTAAQRRAILAPLTSQQRLAIDAYVSASRRQAASCAGGSGSSAGGTIAPSVVDASPTDQPLINTYVS
jgi:hypothetical protein